MCGVTPMASTAPLGVDVGMTTWPGVRLASGSDALGDAFGDSLGEAIGVSLGVSFGDAMGVSLGDATGVSFGVSARRGDRRVAGRRGGLIAGALAHRWRGLTPVHGEDEAAALRVGEVIAHERVDVAAKGLVLVDAVQVDADRVVAGLETLVDVGRPDVLADEHLVRRCRVVDIGAGERRRRDDERGACEADGRQQREGEEGAAAVHVHETPRVLAHRLGPGGSSHVARREIGLETAWHRDSPRPTARARSSDERSLPHAGNADPSLARHVRRAALRRPRLAPWKT